MKALLMKIIAPFAGFIGKVWCKSLWRIIQENLVYNSVLILRNSTKGFATCKNLQVLPFDLIKLCNSLTAEVFNWMIAVHSSFDIKCRRRLSGEQWRNRNLLTLLCKFSLIDFMFLIVWNCEFRNTLILFLRLLPCVSC